MNPAQVRDTLSGASTRTKVVVATTVMLSFISFWRAAAIVLSDLASSAYYAGGIAETQIGKSAPWFILAVMLFSYAVRAIYVESCSMFVRGGVYKVVHEAMGGTLAKISVSALMFDYILTGPISGVSAGLYLAGILNEIGERFHIASLHFKPPAFAAAFAILATLYFWRKNILGMHESSEKALRIMQITTVMVVILIGWCVLTMTTKGFQPVPLPVRANLRLGDQSLGWLKGTIAPTITAVAIMIGLGHSLLAMSGFETLAQVYRELASPKLRNLKRAGNVIFLYSMLFTSLASFFAVMLIPDSERPKYLDNLLGGLSMFLVGPSALKLLFHVFVVVVGTLILAGAVNTAIIGSNGVLNRVAEDGVLPNWFRKPNTKFGTTSRLINTVVILQIVTILLSRGDVNLLGEAYAFGVVWSFSFNALSVLVLRFRQPENREWKVPLNFQVGKVEIPVGLILITLFLFTLACINVFTKELATIAGVTFTLAFFLVFTVSEKINKKRHQNQRQDLEQFRLDQRVEISQEQLHTRPGNVIVACRNPFHLEHLEKTLTKTDTRKVDIVVLSVHRVTAAASGEYDLNADQIFATAEQDLFTKVVTMAEKAGKHVELLAVAATDPWLGMVQTAQRLQSSRIVTGLSPLYASNPAEQGKVVGEAWESLEAPRPSLSLEIVLPDANEESLFFNLGPHPPRLWPEDIDLVHRLWLELSSRGTGAKLHHRDVVGVALSRLERQLHSEQSDEVLVDIDAEVRLHPEGPPVKVPEKVVVNGAGKESALARKAGRGVR
ncbi:MAG TPA: APC family permease [Bryobacteraceae bacterium]|jgi:amino acid transporter|nr:APC family permease [Bryobacteraceae bacterium]